MRLQYCTLQGSKAFNVVQRQRAIDLGYTMNEHGLYHLTGPKKNKKGARVEGDFPTEKSIFDFLGLEYKGPTERKSGKAVVLKSDEPVQEEENAFSYCYFTKKR